MISEWDRMHQMDDFLGGLQEKDQEATEMIIQMLRMKKARKKQKALEEERRRDANGRNEHL